MALLATKRADDRALISALIAERDQLAAALHQAQRERNDARTETAQLREELAARSEVHTVELADGTSQVFDNRLSATTFARNTAWRAHIETQVRNAEGKVVWGAARDGGVGSAGAHHKPRLDVRF